jgi:hypothetical protein
VRVAQDENPLADVDELVGLQRELLPWRIELVIELLNPFVASIHGSRSGKTPGEVELDL